MKRWLTRILICLVLGAVTTVGVAWGISYYNFTKDRQGRTFEHRSRAVILDDESGLAVFGMQRRFGFVTVAPGGRIEDAAATVKRIERRTPRPTVAYGRGALPWWSKARRRALGSEDVPDPERAYGFPFVCFTYELNHLIAERREKSKAIRDRYRELLWHAPTDEWRALRAQERDEIDAVRNLFAEYVHGVEYAKTLKVNGNTRKYVYGAWPLKPIWPHIIGNVVIYAALFWLVLFEPGALRQTLRVRRGACVKCGYDLRGCDEPGCPECGWGRAECEI